MSIKRSRKGEDGRVTRITGIVQGLREDFQGPDEVHGIHARMQ